MPNFLAQGLRNLPKSAQEDLAGYMNPPEYANKLANQLRETTGQADYARWYESKNPADLAAAKEKFTQQAIDWNPAAVGMTAIKSGNWFDDILHNRNLTDEDYAKFTPAQRQELAQARSALPKDQGGLGLAENNTYIDRANHPEMYPVPAYHGGNSNIKAADYAKSGEGADQYGSAALYTATNPHYASGFADPTKDFANVMPLRLRTKGFMADDKVGKLTSKQIETLIKKSPDEYALSNFGDVDYEGLPKVLKTATNSYKDVGNDELLGTLHMINNDFYSGFPGEFNKAASEVTGIRGITADVGGGERFYMPWHESDIRSRFAAFDPFRKNSSDILAGIGAGGVGYGIYGYKPEDEWK